MSTDPAVQAAIEAGEGHLPYAVGRRWSCSCGAPLPADTLWAYEDHLTAARVAAARPIIWLEAAREIVEGQEAQDRHLAGEREAIQAILDGRATTLEDAFGRAAVRTEPEQCGQLSGWTGDYEEPVPPRYRCTLPVGHDGVHNAEPVSEPEQ